LLSESLNDGRDRSENQTWLKPKNENKHAIEKKKRKKFFFCQNQNQKNEK
jgi:hypothetical protein